MRAGMLATRVHILGNTGTADALGQPADAWTFVQSVWADARYQTGLQSLAADRLNGGGRVSLRIRKTSCSKGINSSMRAVVDGILVDGMVIGGITYKIIDTPRQGRDAIDLVCEAV